MMFKSSIASKKLRAQDGSLVKNQSTEMRVTRSKDGKQLTQHSCIPASTAEAIIGPGSAPQIVSRMTALLPLLGNPIAIITASMHSTLRLSRGLICVHSEGRNNHLTDRNAG